MQYYILGDEFWWIYLLKCKGFRDMEFCDDKIQMLYYISALIDTQK